jgi:protein tyrosine kinase modulator
MEKSYYDEEEIDLKTLLSILMDKWKLILGVTAIAGVLALSISGIYSLIKPPIPLYEATTKVSITPEEEKGIQKDVFKDLAKSQTTMGNVVNKLKLKEDPKELLKGVTAQYQEGTNILEITMKHKNPDLSQKIANNLRREAVNYSNQAMDVASIHTVESATLSEEILYDKEPINIVLNTVIGMVLGLMGIVFFIFLQNALNDKIQTKEDVEKHLGQKVLAIVPSTEKR